VSKAQPNAQDSSHVRVLWEISRPCTVFLVCGQAKSTPAGFLHKSHRVNNYFILALGYVIVAGGDMDGATTFYF
jgi:hypothetical protein